jgi:multicomponent K+:H+ antiporter subunit G
MATVVELFVCFFLLAGAGFALLGSIGLFKLPDFYMRLHGPTKASTIGVGGALIASLIHFTAQGTGVTVQEVLVTLFLFLTAPISAHMMAKAALHRRVARVRRTRAPDHLPEG